MQLYGGKREREGKAGAAWRGVGERKRRKREGVWGCELFCPYTPRRLFFLQLLLIITPPSPP
jgi:hypothetical protein